MSQPDRAPMTRFACPKCSRPMQARAEYAGRSTRCPGCQHQLTIPGPDGDNAAPGRLRSGGKAGLLIGLAVVVLIALGGACAAWYFWPKGAGGGPAPVNVQHVFNEYDDLDLLPATAQGVATLRVAELWQRPALRKAIEEGRKRDPNRPEPAAELEKNLGLTPDDVERLSLVLIDGDTNLGYAVARTSKPYDGPKVLSRFAGAAERTHSGISYYSGTAANGQPGAVRFVSPRVLILSTEPGVKRALEVLRTPAKEGPLAAVIALARGGKHHGVLGASPSSGGTKELRKNAQLASLADIKTATGTLDVAEKAVLALRIEMPDDAKAKKMRADLNKALAFVRLGLVFAQGNPEQAEGAKLAAKLLNALTISQKGPEVSVSAATDEETAVAALFLALAQAR